MEITRFIADSLQATPSENKVRVPFVAAALIALIASGCGGGGGGGDGGGSNAAPVLSSASFSTNEDTDLSGQLTATDANGDAVTFAKATDPTHGTLTSLNTSGAFVYKPSANYSGNDSFSVRLTDARGSAVTSNIAISIAAVNDAPLAVNDVTRVDGAGLASINVKSNDSDAEGDAITVSIEEPASVGTATVNSDGTVRLNLPAGFKGVTRFKYRASDPTSAASSATAAIFVGTDPFRVAFAGDEAANSQPEIFMTDFVATFRVSAATEGNLRLRAFAAAENGSTIAYIRRDTSTNALDLSFVRTANTGTQVRVTLPGGYSLASGANQVVVSRDGNWIAFLATTTTPTQKISPFVLSVSDPATIHNVEPSAGSLYASQLKFANDSSYLYFLDSTTTATRRTIYRTQLPGANPGSAVASTSGSTGEDVREYQVAQDQARVVFAATRSGDLDVYSVNPAAPGIETVLSTGHSGQNVDSTTVSRPFGLGTPSDGSPVAYTTSFTGFSRAWIVDVSGPSSPEFIAPYPDITAVGLSPDGEKLLYSRPAAAFPFQTQIWERTLVGGADAAIGDGVDALYDSDQSTVLLTEQVGSGNNAYNIVTTAYAGNYGSTTQLGTAGKAARFSDLSGAARAVALIGEGATSGAVASVHLALINARKPDASLFLGTFNSPVDFGSSLATVVTY